MLRIAKACGFAKNTDVSKDLYGSRDQLGV